MLERSKRKVKSTVTLGPLIEGEVYTLISISHLDYVIDVGGIPRTYSKKLFYYKG
jgi:hypothetical protein